MSRLERGRVSDLPMGRVAAIASVLGLRLHARLYPGGQPLRDSAQVQLLERLRQRLFSQLRCQAEVGLPIVGDLRAWDASIGGRGWTVYVDAETRIRDAQALARRTALKRRDTRTERVILLIADTRSNRAAVRAVGAPLVDGALPGLVILKALEAGRDPGGSGVVLL